MVSEGLRALRPTDVFPGGIGLASYLVTVTRSVADLPSTLTVIVVVPTLRAVTMPEAETEAIVVDLDVYVAEVFVAFDGLIIGTIWYVLPMRSVILVSGSATDSTGILTVTVQEATRALLSLVAVMTATPADMPTTLPFGSTLATLSLLEVQVTPLIVAFVGLKVTVRVAAEPAFSASVRLLIAIEVVGLASILTVTVHSALILPVVSETVIVTTPALMPVTTPPLTVAMELSDELHAIPDLSALNGVINGASVIVLPTPTPAVGRRFRAVTADG